MKQIRMGIMGFGRIGRQLYRLAQDQDRFEVVAVSDIGRPEILHHLLTKTLRRKERVTLEGNYLVGEGGNRTRLMPANHPTEIPWDVFGVDIVIDATGRFRTRRELAPHLDNGARRVISSTLPDSVMDGNVMDGNGMDRVVVYGVNHHEAAAEDRIVSAGSATTTAAALALKTLTEAYAVDQASMTSVHEYTSDQSLRDYAGPDYRRSRSGAENIIPNVTPARAWVQRVLPAVDGKFSAYAMNVPVPDGSVVDLFVELARDATVEDVHEAMLAAAQSERMRGVLEFTTEPVVSSDIVGNPHSCVFDGTFTQVTGGRYLKSLSWYDNEWGYSNRVCDVLARMATFD